MTIEGIAKALPTLDAGTLEGTALERRNLQGEFGRQNPDHNVAQWKLAILRQLKEVNHDA